MRRLPWHVAVRADRRALLTALGVALGVAFTVVSFAVPDGLRTETIAPEGPFGRQDVVVMAPGFEPFDASSLENATIARLAEVPLRAGRNVTLVAFEGPRAPPLSDGFAYPPAGAIGLPPSIVPNATGTALDIALPLDLPILSRSWIAVTPATLHAVRPDLGPRASYALLPPPVAPELASRLAAEGYVLAPAPAVEPFFRASGAEIARDLLLVVAFSTSLVALFTYEFLRSEVRERWREIGVWRALGMRPIDVVALLLARALAITAAGALAGLGLAAIALQAASRASGSAVFSLKPNPWTVLALAAAFLLAGALGGYVPARTAARALVRDQLEAAP